MFKEKRNDKLYLLAYNSFTKRLYVFKIKLGQDIDKLYETVNKKNVMKVADVEYYDIEVHYNKNIDHIVIIVSDKMTTCFDLKTETKLNSGKIKNSRNKGLASTKTFESQGYMIVQKSSFLYDKVQYMLMSQYEDSYTASCLENKKNLIDGIRPPYYYNESN